MTKPNDTTYAIRTALSTLSGVLTVTEERTTESGAKETINRLGFVQERVLNGLTYSVERNLQATVARHSKARDELASALAAEDGTEISENVINRKIGWLERLDEQLAVLNLLFAEAKAAYEASAGKPYVTPPKSVAGPTDKESLRAKATRALEAAKAWA